TEIALLPAVAEMDVVEDECPVERARIRIDQELVRIEPVTLLRRIEAMHAIAVAPASRDAGDIAVPEIACAFGKREPRDFLRSGVVEEAELDLLRMRGEEHEIRAVGVRGNAKRFGEAGSDLETHYPSSEARGST